MRLNESQQPRMLLILPSPNAQAVPLMHQLLTRDQLLLACLYTEPSTGTIVLGIIQHEGDSNKHNNKQKG